MLIDGDDEGLVAIARQQIDAGARALDVCVAMPGHADEAGLMDRVVNLLAGAVDVPLVIDSTDPAVFERTLPRLQGRAIANSINIAGRTRIESVLPGVLAHDAAVVALCIDEDGMARTRDRKLAVARRLRDVIVKEHGLAPDRLLIDPLTFPIGRSEEGAMVETIEGVRLITREMPEVRTILGISDVSFGLPSPERRAVNLAFLRRCADAGLHAAILNPADLRSGDPQARGSTATT